MKRFGLLLAFAFVSANAFAQTKPAPAPPKPAAPPPAPAAPVITHTSAIVHIATEVARGLGNVPAGALVAVSPLASDVANAKGDDLAMRVVTQIAGRLGVAHAHPQPVSLGVARGASGRAASLVYVQLELAKGELRATADLYPVVSNGWERLRNPAPGPQAHAFVGSPIDAEIRTFLPPIVLEQAAVHKAKHEETDVLAVGCGDLDSDGGLELVLASRTKVSIGKLRGGKFSLVRSTPWAQLASRAPVPLRETAASVVVTPKELFLGTTDRGGVVVDSSLVTRRQLTGMPISGGKGDVCALAAPEWNAFDGTGVTCAVPPKGEPAPMLTTPTTRFDAIAMMDLVSKEGAISQVVAAREAGGKLRVRRSDASGKAQDAPIDGAGAQVVVADLDLDGQPEVAFSAELDKENDALIVWSWRPNGFVQRLRYPTKEPVRAIAACPPEEKGVPGLVAIVGQEIWLVR